MLRLEFIEERLINHIAGFALRRFFDCLTEQQSRHPFVNVAFKDAQLVFDVLGDALDFHRLDFFRTRVFFHAITGVNAHVHYGAIHAGRHAQRAVFNVRGFLAKNRAQEFLFRRLRALALRRDFTDEDIACLHFRTDMDNTGAVQLRQRTFLDVRDVAADFF